MPSDWTMEGAERRSLERPLSPLFRFALFVLRKDGMQRIGGSAAFPPGTELTPMSPPPPPLSRESNNGGSQPNTARISPNSALPRDLYERCYPLLLRSTELDSTSSLEALFQTDELKPFLNRIRDADGKDDRVTKQIAWLQDARLRVSRPVFPIFLRALRDRYDENDQHHVDLGRLANDVAAALGTPGAGTPSLVDTGPRKPESVTREANGHDIGTIRADFLVVTPLREERDAVLRKLPGYRKAPPSRDEVRVYYEADLPATFSDGTEFAYRVVVVPLLNMRRVEAANTTGDAIRRWRPRYVLLVGIAGGLARAGVGLGDVLVSNQTVDYELQKLTETETEIRWKVHQVDPSLLGVAQNLLDAGWQQLIKENRPGRGIPKQHFGPICTGDKVIANARIDEYREVWSRLIGVEMEAGGTTSAAFHAADSPRVLHDPRSLGPRRREEGLVSCPEMACFRVRCGCIVCDRAGSE